MHPMASPQRTIILGNETDGAVAEMADAQGRTFSGMVRWIVEQYLREGDEQ